MWCPRCHYGSEHASGWCVNHPNVRLSLMKRPFPETPKGKGSGNQRPKFTNSADPWKDGKEPAKVRQARARLLGRQDNHEKGSSGIPPTKPGRFRHARGA